MLTLDRHTHQLHGGIWEGTIEGVEEEKGADEGLMRRVRGLFGRG